MADELFETPPQGEAGSKVASQAAQPGNGSQPVQPVGNTDSRLAAILAKKEAGQPLTHKERGYLGSVRRKSKPAKVVQPADSNPLFEPAPAAVPPADNPLFEAAPPTDGVVQAPTADSYATDRLHAAANRILTGVDFGTKLYIGWEAKQAGGDKLTVQKWKEAVALKNEQREMIVENSDDAMIWLCEQLGCSPEEVVTKLQGGGLLAGFGAYLFGVGRAVKELRELRKENEQRKQQQPEPDKK